MFLRSVRYLLSFVVCTWFCLLAMVCLSPHALAASNPITVTAQTDTISFPKGIDFQMSAADASTTITLASIHISYEGTSVNTTHMVPIKQAAATVTLQWHEDTSGQKFVTPGTQISYYWQILDTLNNSYTGAAQTFTVVDTRFNWLHQSHGLLQINWYNRPLNFGQIMLDQTNNTVQRIGTNLGSGLLHPINIWIYQNNDDFHGSLAPGSYEWVGGIAFPALNQASIVVETPADTTTIRDLPHELTHLLFHQIAGQSTLVPLWFDEGLAVYNQAYHEPDMKLRLKQGLTSHTLLRLTDIMVDFPADADKAYLAYAQSWNLLDYMYSTFGQPRMVALIKDTNNTSMSFNDDLNQALGLDQAHLENQWRVSLNQPPTLTTEQTNTKSVVPQKPIQVQVATNPYAPTLFLFGIMLVILPMIGLGGLFAYQRKSQQSSRIASQGMMNATMSSYGTSSTMSYAPYTNAPSYMTQPPYPAYQSYVPQTPPNARPMQEKAIYPSGNQQAGNAWPPSAFTSGQEYSNYRSEKQVSQE